MQQTKGFFLQKEHLPYTRNVYSGTILLGGFGRSESPTFQPKRIQQLPVQNAKPVGYFYVM